jgi:hypothetical protein
LAISRATNGVCAHRDDAHNSSPQLSSYNLWLTYMRNHSGRLWLAVLLLLTGCGGEPGNATITGKVSVDGKPVTGGFLLFIPTGGSGKPAEAEVQSDGNFKSTATTAGKCTVSYSPPTIPSIDLKEGESPPPGEFDSLTPKQAEVDIKDGANKLDIELTKIGAPPAG